MEAVATLKAHKSLLDLMSPNPIFLALAAGKCCGGFHQGPICTFCFWLLFHSWGGIFPQCLWGLMFGLTEF